MSQFGQRPELGSRLFLLTAALLNPVPAVPTQLSPTGGTVGKVSAILIEADPANTNVVEIGPTGLVFGNGILLNPGVSILLKLSDAQNVMYGDPNATGVQNIRVMLID